MITALCVGLGNPGPQYARTRHNIGFWVIDAAAACCGIQQLTRKQFYGTWAQAERPNGTIGLLQPQTYMNRSGEAVAAALHFWKLGSDRLIVIHDDLDLELAQLKLAFRRGAGGHRGVESIIATLGTADFWRLRVGIGRPPVGRDPADYVLTAFAADQRVAVDEAVERATSALWTWLDEGPDAVMQKYHGRNNQKKTEDA